MSIKENLQSEFQELDREQIKYRDQLKDLETRREEIFRKLQADRDNPYWYEDWGCIIDELDQQIAHLKQSQILDQPFTFEE